MENILKDCNLWETKQACHLWGTRRILEFPLTSVNDSIIVSQHG